MPVVNENFDGAAVLWMLNSGRTEYVIRDTVTSVGCAL